MGTSPPMLWLQSDTVRGARSLGRVTQTRHGGKRQRHGFCEDNRENDGQNYSKVRSDKPWLGRSKGVKAEKAAARLRGRIYIKATAGGNRSIGIARSEKI